MASFASSLIAGFAGFLAMLACAFVVERNLRKMGRAGLDSLTASMKGSRLKTLFGSAGKTIKRPFRRDES